MTTNGKSSGKGNGGQGKAVKRSAGTRRSSMKTSDKGEPIQARLFVTSTDTKRMKTKSKRPTWRDWQPSAE